MSAPVIVVSIQLDAVEVIDSIATGVRSLIFFDLILSIDIVNFFVQINVDSTLVDLIIEIIGFVILVYHFIVLIQVSLNVDLTFAFVFVVFFLFNSVVDVAFDVICGVLLAVRAESVVKYRNELLRRDAECVHVTSDVERIPDKSKFFTIRVVFYIEDKEASASCLVEFIMIDSILAWKSVTLVLVAVRI